MIKNYSVKRLWHKQEEHLFFLKLRIWCIIDRRHAYANTNLHIIMSCYFPIKYSYNPTLNAFPNKLKRVSTQDWPVDVWVLQVEQLTGVISQDEREHRVLHEVVEGAARMLVEMREVLEVRDLSRAPQLSERRDVSVFQQVGQIRGQDVVVDIVTELAQEHREPWHVFHLQCLKWNMEKLLTCKCNEWMTQFDVSWFPEPLKNEPGAFREPADPHKITQLAWGLVSFI